MNPEPKAVVRVGPAGWSYDDWKGIVYPEPMPRTLHPLTFLCRYFDTVEVNASFYRPLHPRHAAAWADKVADNPRFLFTAKLWERFTHQRDEWPEPNEIARFHEGLTPLADAGKLGALLVQFPWSFKRTPGNRLYLARVLDAFARHPLAVELRHASWNRPEVFKTLADRAIAFCNIDQPLFADSLPPTAEVTAPLGYVRLHGRNRSEWFREDAGRDDRYDYLYSEDELRPWIERIRLIATQAGAVYVITNNHFRGQAIVNALEIQLALGRPVPEIPPQLAAAYPRLVIRGQATN